MYALLPARFCRIPLATDKFILHSRRRRDRQPFSIVDQPLAFSRSSFSLPLPPASRLSVSFCCLLPLTPRFSSLFLISFFSTSTSLRSKNRRSRAYSMAIDRDAHRSSNPAALRESFSFKQTFTHSLATLSFSSALSRLLGFTFRFFLSMAFLLARGVQHLRRSDHDYESAENLLIVERGSD